MAVDLPPARREDGTLKDASEMEWLHSPSDECRPLPDLSEKPGLGDSSGNNSGQSTASSSQPAKVFRGKEPAKRVAGKRVSKPSGKVAASKGQHLTPKTRRFFTSRFEGEYLARRVVDSNTKCYLISWSGYRGTEFS